MSRNFQRQLALLDMPAGDLGAFKKEGGKIKLYDFGGGGQPSATTQTTDLPDWAKPYAKDALAKGAALTDINKNPYQAYKGERIAGFQPLQEQAFKTVGGMDAGPAGFQAGIGQYMSPYMQNVVDIEKREAGRQAGIAGTQQQAQATQAGAFGGGRDAIMRAERERNLAQQMGDIQAKGSQAAYEQAANQFRQGITQQAGLAGQQAAMGQMQQQQAQRPLDMAYQDFLNQQNYPYKQLGYMSDLIRGLPLGQKSTSTVYEAPGSLMGQLGGLGMGAYGLSKMFADGGMIDNSEPVIRYADGGSVTDVNNVENILEKLSDQQLQQAKEAALNRRDAEQAQMIDAEIARRNAVRQPGEQPMGGIAPALPEQFADQMEQSMATGGIVAFADGDVVSENKTSRFSQSGLGRLLNAISPPDAQQQEAERLRKYNEFISASQAQPGFFENVAPEKLKQSEKQVEEAARQLTANKAPPAQTKAVDSVKPSTTSTAGAGRGSYQDYVPAQDIKGSGKSEKPALGLSEITAGSKPSKTEVKSAVAQFAEQNKLGTEQKEDLMTTALKIREELGKQNQPILDKLNAAIEAQKPDEQAIKDKGLAQALTQFGFGMAERASKPGARFLESASGAAPVLGAVAAKTDELLQSRKDNYTKLQLDQAKYEVALAKGDMQTAATLAGQIRQANQQDKLLQFHIANAQDQLALEKQKLAQQGAYQNQMASRYETVGSLTRDIMKNEGLPYDKALEKAGNIMKGGIPAGVRGDASTKIALAKELDAIEKNYPAMLRSGDSKMAQENRRAYEAAINRVYSIYGGSAQGDAGSAQPAPGAKRIKLNQNGEIIQ